MNAPALRFAMVVHNHQPVGNFDEVIEQAYQDSYLPFLRQLARFPQLRLSLHLSGSLFDWLAQTHPEYLDAVGELSRLGQLEILGGAYYEPILPMLPRRDRRGQIRTYTHALQRRFGHAPLGMWLSERVWEQQLAGDLGACGIQHTVLDDFHFRQLGLDDGQLHGYYLTEDDGRALAIFPGRERLRYLMPFAPPEQTLDYLRAAAQANPGGLVVFADDGEKFGSWPGMKQHVHAQGWLARFFELLADNADWLRTTTLAEAVREVAPLGKIYVPDGSYREMTEWAQLAPASPQPLAFSAALRSSWRNFQVKYPEAGEMHARMLMVSHRLETATTAGHADAALLDQARRELYRAQCNCAYWHGTFAGVYLAHLRQSVYQCLIAAENLLDRATGRVRPWVEAWVADFNQDVQKEVLLANDRLAAFFSPQHGGRLYELDVRASCHNLLATLARRPEPYHAELPAELQAHVVYDRDARKSLVDHFFADDATLADVMQGRARELGDFATGRYEAELFREPSTIRVQLSRTGRVAEYTIQVTKSIALAAGGKQLDVEYRLAGLPRGQTFHFGVEFNFSGLPGQSAERGYHEGPKRPLGHLGEVLDLANKKSLGLFDEHLGLDVGFKLSRPAQIWAFPLHAVNRSERGMELTQQSVVVLPRWSVQADAQGCWTVSIRMPIETSLAESRVKGSRTPRPARLSAAA